MSFEGSQQFPDPWAVNPSAAQAKARERYVEQPANTDTDEFIFNSPTEVGAQVSGSNPATEAVASMPAAEAVYETADAEMESFDPATHEGIAQIKAFADELVTAAETYRTTASQAGYKGLRYRDYIGAQCFSALEQMKIELEGALTSLEEDIEADTRSDESWGEAAEEVGGHLEEMVALQEAIVLTYTESVASPELADEQISSLTALRTQAEHLYTRQHDRFPESVRLEAGVDVLLMGIQTDRRRAADLIERADDEDVSQELAELQERLGEYDERLNEIYDEWLPEIKAIRGEAKTTEVTDGAEVEAEVGTPEPFTLTADVRVTEGVDEAALESLEAEVLESLRGIDSNPYYTRAERETLKVMYTQYETALESGNLIQIKQKLHNLKQILDGVERPVAETLKERTDRIVAEFEYLQFTNQEAADTATAMAENFYRVYQDPDTEEATLQKVYQSLEEFVLESADHTPALYAQELPVAGPAGVHNVRALRRLLVGVADSRSGVELTRGQKRDIEAMITLLQYAQHDQLTDDQADELRYLAARVQNGEMILPRAELPVSGGEAEGVDEAGEGAEAAEESPVKKTGKISLATEDIAESEESLPIMVKETIPQEVSELESLEPGLQSETWEFSGESDAATKPTARSLEDLKKTTSAEASDWDRWDEVAEVVAAAHPEPAPVVGEPVPDDLAAADEAALAAAEATDPIDDAVPGGYDATDAVVSDVSSVETERMYGNKLQSWEERAERAKGLSLAKQYISGELAQRLSERDITPSDLDRRVKSYTADFERRFVSRFDVWMGEQTGSVYERWRDVPVQDFLAVSKEFTAANRSEFEEKYKVKYDLFAGWQDKIVGEFREVVEDYSPDMTLGELLTKFIATVETQ